MNPLYPFPNKKRRKYVPKSAEATARRTQAQRENFAIFLLKGRSTYFLKGVLPAKYIKALERLQKDCIQEIKNTQAERMRLRKIEAKKGKKR